MKFALSLLLFCCSLFLSAQNFEWAASGSRLHTGFHLSTVTVDGRLVAAGQYQQPSYDPMPGPVELYSGSGDVVPFDKYNNQMFVVCYNSKGNVDWTLYGGERLGGGTIHGLSSRQDGTVLIQFRSGYVPYCQTFINPENGKSLKVDSLFSERDAYENQSTYYKFEFIAEVNGRGDIQQITGLLLPTADEWTSFRALGDGGFLMAFSNDVKAADTQGRNREVMHNFTLKLNSKFQREWLHQAMYLDSSCCSVMENRSGAIETGNGEIAIYGSFREGIRMAGSPDFRLPKDPKAPKGLRYGSYLALLDSKGKLKWARFSDGLSVISSVDARNNQLVFGGEVLHSPRFFGTEVDTSEGKRAFLAAMSESGKLLWKQTFNAKNTQSVCSDEEGNLFASFRSQQSKGMAPLKIGTDTISDSYESVVVASFDAKGTYRWYRMSRARMSINTISHLHADLCGNLYFTGEMWYVLPVNMSVFDGAFIRGSGYGGAPLAARIRTTIPENLLAMNLSITQAFEIRRKEKQNVNKKASNAVAEPNSLVNAIQRDSSLAANTGRALGCTPIPFPWSVVVFPNPATGPLTLRANTSYADPAVSVILTDARGALVRVLVPPQFKDAGMLDYTADVSGLAKGLYFVVLKGTASAATFSLVIQ